jgi:hypothetical protein
LIIEIYSTYLLGSLRDHDSARRLLNTKNRFLLANESNNRIDNTTSMIDDLDDLFLQAIASNERKKPSPSLKMTQQNFIG